MTIKYLYISIFILFSASLFSQDFHTSEYSYKRMEGNIGGEFTLTAHLIQVIDQLYGNYRYASTEQTKPEEVGKTIELSGELFAGDSARLKQLGQKSYVFNGRFTDENYSGMWTLTEGEEVPFEMVEFYPDGSLSLDVHYLHSESILFPDSLDSPSAEIELLMLYPRSDSIHKDILDSVRLAIIENFYGSGFQPDSPDSMLIRFEQEYFETYLNQNREFYTGGASFNWEKMNTMSVVYNSNHILCLEYLAYAYTGGAHGMSKISYSTINLNDGSSLDFENIFKKGSQNELGLLLTAQIRSDFEIPDDVSLVEAGLFTDTIAPNDNIYINGNGIGFLFNHYEIAPYSYGVTNVFLSWDKIKHLLREDSPAYLAFKST